MSLLVRLRDADAASWSRFVRLYRPLLLSWTRRYNLQSADAEDLIQDVLLRVNQNLNRFDRQRDGSFRKWLRTICLNRIREIARARKLTLFDSLDDLPAPEEEAFWESEYRQKLIASALMLMKTDFEESTWRACWEQVMSERNPQEIAVALGMTVESVYSARSRVLKRLRDELREFLE
jgi:RNA polymerase sigma-70 factor (ECF subfamily)